MFGPRWNFILVINIMEFQDFPAVQRENQGNEANCIN